MKVSVFVLDNSYDMNYFNLLNDLSCESSNNINDLDTSNHTQSLRDKLNIYVYHQFCCFLDADWPICFRHAVIHNT